MSLAIISKRNRVRKKLHELLSVADDEAFFRMVWATDALQSDRPHIAAKHLTFPQEAATSRIDSRFSIHEWELETLVGMLLVTSKKAVRAGKNRTLNCATFGAVSTAANLLREIENAESGLYLERFGVLTEMHRIGNRQFPWQHGYANATQFYRNAYIYGQGECAQYFQNRFGITINDFSLAGFAFFASYQEFPQIKRPFDIPFLGMNPQIVETALTLLSLPIKMARAEMSRMLSEANTKHGNALPTAYRPGFLRRFPLVSFGDKNQKVFSPLPALIVLRITAGLYYDIVGGGTKLLNEANERFEIYSEQYISKLMPRFETSRQYKYVAKGNQIETPDILVRDGGNIRLVIECKAAKLTFAAQFSDDPVTEAKQAFNQIANGIVQLWRFFSHGRLGLFNAERIAPDALGMLLTLDPWLMLSPPVRDKVFDLAKTLSENDKDIIDEDKRSIVICSVQELEAVLLESNEDDFLGAISAANEIRYRGWMFRTVFQETQKEKPPSTAKPFPFDVGNVLPWWTDIERMKQARQNLKSQN